MTHSIISIIVTIIAIMIIFTILRFVFKTALSLIFALLVVSILYKVIEIIGGF